LFFVAMKELHSPISSVWISVVEAVIVLTR